MSQRRRGPRLRALGLQAVEEPCELLQAVPPGPADAEEDDAGSKLVFHVFGTVAEFERDLILQRTMAGLKAAKARGRHGGRPRALDGGKAKLARRSKDDAEHSVLRRSAPC